MNNQLPIPASFNNSDNDRVIQGTLLKCVDGRWADRDGVTFSPEAKMLALGTAQAAQRWDNRRPVETIIREPGKPFPDVATLNAKTSQADWEIGLDGTLKPPWVLQHIVYLLDPADASLFTFINGTTGARIAVEQLADKVRWMRQLRGEHVVPLVRLAARPMKTPFGQKMRPDFAIVEWRDAGARTRSLALGDLGIPVEPVTSAEAMDDEISF